MIENTLGQKGRYVGVSEQAYIEHFLQLLAERFWRGNPHSKLFGVTVRDGAFVMYRNAAGQITAPMKVTSRFMCGSVVDLCGAGDSFRAGLTAYLARNAESFKTGRIAIEQAIQMGNLFASLYVKSPLNKRYENIGSYDKMLAAVCGSESYVSFEALTAAVK